MDDGELLVPVRVSDEHLEHEPVDLRLRKGIRPLGLDRILRRHHEERRRDDVRVVADGDLVLLHHLEECRLHLRRRAVDLVCEEEVAEDRAEVGLEPTLIGSVDTGPDEVGGDEVGRELDPPERAAEHGGGRLDRQRLGEARHALDQEMAAGDEAHEHALEHLVLTGDHALHLDEGLLEPGARPFEVALGRRLRERARRDDGLAFRSGHVWLLASTSAASGRAARPSPDGSRSRRGRCCGVVTRPA